MSDLPRVIPPGGGSYITKIDEPDANTTYIGYAARGTATSTAGWLIKRIVKSGNVTTTEWASEEFDQIYDNRASLSYS